MPEDGGQNYGGVPRERRVRRAETGDRLLNESAEIRRLQKENRQTQLWAPICPLFHAIRTGHSELKLYEIDAFISFS